jgi:hypothetical protein
MELAIVTGSAGMNCIRSGTRAGVFGGKCAEMRPFHPWL